MIVRVSPQPTFVPLAAGRSTRQADDHALPTAPASRTTDMRRPQTARLGQRQINARRSPGDNGLHSLSLSPAIVLDLPLPLTLTLHLNSPLALELSRRFPLEPLSSKPSPRFFRPTRPSAGSPEPAERTPDDAAAKDQTTPGWQPSGPPHAGGHSRCLAVKTPYDFVPPGGGSFLEVREFCVVGAFLSESG